MRAKLTLAGMMALSGCASLAPPLEPASAPEIAAPESWQQGEAAPVAPAGDWVGQFNDPILTDLVVEALESNPGIRSAEAQLAIAAATLDRVDGATEPSLTASADGGWSSNVFEVLDNPVRTDSANFGLTLGANWEADLWGRLQAGVAASAADVAATQADLEAARLSVATRTALAWVQLNEALRQEQLARDTLDARERTLRLTERRFERGLSGALDVRLARSSVASSKALIIQREQATGQARRQIEVLLGRYPATEIAGTGRIYPLDVLQAQGDPLALLARRPDVRSAEAQIVAAGFRVDQARAALKPSLGLSASLSTSDDELINALNPEYLAFRTLASLTAPLYRGGALKADIRAAEARAELASASYVSTVLQAWREVEDALEAEVLLAARESAERQALEEARFAEELAERQYQNGLASIFNLIDAQTRRINSESSLLSVQSARVLNRINYHLALGGGVLPVATRPDRLTE